jgi:hypothetical protein
MQLVRGVPPSSGPIGAQTSIAGNDSGAGLRG